ncbi:MAG: hypothetical protein OEZ34_00345 [Spirochaetia bacterium]|nr:hypothetical protein [Spirochaetia bacterium]
MEIGNLIINAGTADVIAVIVPPTVFTPDVNDTAELRSVVKKVLNTLLKDIDRQIESNYRSGATVSIVFKGMTVSEFTNARIFPAMKNIRGVNSVFDIVFDSRGESDKV